MSYTTRQARAMSSRRPALGQELDAATSSAIVSAAQANAITGATPTQANAQVTAANAARQAAMIRPIAIGAGALALFIGGSWALNLVAKRAAGIDGSVWSATGKQQLIYTGLSLGVVFPVALAMKASGVDTAILNATRSQT
jgi:hypothetical protein